MATNLISFTRTYSKAFDRIGKDLLVRKSQNVRINGDLFNSLWLKSYINNRSKNYVSGILARLFAIFVNYIEHCYKSLQLVCFVHDMKIIAPISSESDAIPLQEDLMRLDTFCSDNT